MTQNDVPDASLNKKILAVLEQCIASKREVGVQVAAYHQGAMIVNASAGRLSDSGSYVTDSSLFPIFSVIKGVLAAAAHILAERDKLNIDAPIASYWPEFGAHGKSEITLRHVFSHTAGVPQMPADVTTDTIIDWVWMTQAIANLKPLHAPGEQSYYHGMTYGWLLGEAIRRSDLQKRGINTFIQEEIVKPLALTGLYVSTPECERGQVATLSGAPYPTNLPEDIPIRIGIPAAVDLQAEIFNRPEIQSAEIPAVGGYANAGSIAKFYAMLAGGGAINGIRLLSTETVKTFSVARPNSDAPDPFLGAPTPLSIGGYMLGGMRPAVGPHKDTLFNIGAGGSIAWADQRNNLAVAFTHNHMYGHQTPENDLQIILGNLIREHLGIK